MCSSVQGGSVATLDHGIHTVGSLMGRDNLKHKTKELTLKVGDVVLIQSEERNHGKWSIGIVVKLIEGCDSVV